jgi:hypothetical protein
MWIRIICCEYNTVFSDANENVADIIIDVIKTIKINQSNRHYYDLVKIVLTSALVPVRI